MKKLLQLILINCFLINSLQALPLINIRANADYLSGDASDKLKIGADESSDFEMTSNFATALYFEHFIPLIPNIGVRYTDYTLETKSPSLKLESEITDYLIYYSILSLDIVSLDLGINVSNQKIKASSKKTFTNPQLYAKAQSSFLTRNFYGFTTASVFGKSGESISQFDIGLGYKFINNLAFKSSINLGYRNIMFDIDNKAGATTKSNTNNLFLGLEFEI